MENMKPFEIDGNEHQVSNKECPDCWSSFPVECECGGLIHAGFGDENRVGDYWLYYKCDKCGSTEPPE